MRGGASPPLHTGERAPVRMWRYLRRGALHVGAVHRLQQTICRRHAMIRGTCPYCYAVIAVRRGALAVHTDFAVADGLCPGAGKQPLEVDPQFAAVAAWLNAINAQAVCAAVEAVILGMRAPVERITAIHRRRSLIDAVRAQWEPGWAIAAPVSLDYERADANEIPAAAPLILNISSSLARRVVAHRQKYAKHMRRMQE